MNKKYYANFEADKFYHVLNHAVGTENLFRKQENYQYFLKRYNDYTEDIWDTYAFCLMPNHFHLLIRVKSTDEIKVLEKYTENTHKFIMQKLSNFLNAYAKAFNTMFERKGALFIDATKRIEIKNDNYLTNVINYIHQNPVHHGFCESLGDWQYSSYRSFLSDRDSKLKRKEVLAWFGNEELFKKFHTENNAVLLNDFE